MFIERKKRINVVLGVISLILIGILIDIFSRIFYELMILKKTSSDAEVGYIYILFALVIFISSFTSFLIVDFKNNRSPDKNFIYRLFQYYEDNDPANNKNVDLTRITLAIIWLVLKWVATIHLFTVLVDKVNPESGFAWLILVGTWVTSKIVFSNMKNQ